MFQRQAHAGDYVAGKTVNPPEVRSGPLARIVVRPDRDIRNTTCITVSISAAIGPCLPDTLVDNAPSLFIRDHIEHIVICAKVTAVLVGVVVIGAN